MSAATWNEIHDELLRRIRVREWAPGALIPGELALAEEFGCARATVGRALTRLADEGMLDRRRRAGTRVATSPVRRATLAIPVIRAEVEATGAVYRHALLERTETPAPDQVSARMGLAAGIALLHLRTLHLADDRPHAYEDRWVNTDAVPGIAQAALNETSANEWLVSHAWYSDGTLGFQAELAGPQEAALLQIAPGAAVFVLDRLTWAGDIPVTSVRLVYPPGHRMVTKL